MIRQSLIPIESPGEWNETLKGIDHAFGHTLGSGALLNYFRAFTGMRNLIGIDIDLDPAHAPLWSK